MEAPNKADRLPFFEVEHNHTDDRYGRIRAGNDAFGHMGELDYFHGISDDIRVKTHSSQAFVVTRMTLTRDMMSNSLEKALLYIAACIADDAGEEVIYCKPDHKAQNSTCDLWEILGVRNLLDNYDAVVQTV
ncbi:MAG: hypothetical protein AB8G77_21425 [Rhodothermales bacterium]